MANKANDINGVAIDIIMIVTIKPRVQSIRYLVVTGMISSVAATSLLKPLKKINFSY